MKIRYDFVSNSSSASFIVNGETGDAKLLIQKMNETFCDNQIPWGFNEYIEIRLKVKNKDYKYVWKMFHEEESQFEDTYTDYKTGTIMTKDPEEVAWESIFITLEDILSPYMLKVIDKICSIIFESQNENDELCNNILSMLYKYFDAIDCHPDISISERDFLHTNDEPMYNKMKETILNKGKYTL